jgi:endonuclease/exonuclease/phosphatase family metal-dependent hydrolase
MGDLNESPQSGAVYSSLKARERNSNADLVNLSYEFKSNVAEGTIKYRGQWDIFDQIIVSRALLNKQFRMEGLSVVDLPFLLETDKSYAGEMPFRTYLGPQYHGGFSDHLPVKVIVVKE